MSRRHSLPSPKLAVRLLAPLMEPGQPLPALTLGQHMALHGVVSRTPLTIAVLAEDRIHELLGWLSEARSRDLPWARGLEWSCEQTPLSITQPGTDWRLLLVDALDPRAEHTPGWTTRTDDVRRVRWIPLFRGQLNPPADEVRDALIRWVAIEHRTPCLDIVVPPPLDASELPDAAKISTERGFAARIFTTESWDQAHDAGHDIVWVGAPPTETLVRLLARRDVTYGTGTRVLLAPVDGESCVQAVRAALDATGRLQSEPLDQVAEWMGAGRLEERAILHATQFWALNRAIAQVLVARVREDAGKSASGHSG